LEISELAAEVLRSKKHAGIDIAVVERICAEESKKYPKKKEAVKAAKNTLHIIHESFLPNECHREALVFLRQLPPGADPEQKRAVGLRLMGLHASTRERLADIHEISAFISQYITCESSVMDIGCGFSPFALPLLREAPKSYIAYDINTETIDLLNQYFSLLELPAYRAALLDAAIKTPDAPVDIALLFKLLPLLQQQKKERGFELLSELDFKLAIVSFPLRSLGGKQKGMESFYSSLMEGRLPENLAIADKVSFPNEMFYVIKKTIP